MKIYQVTVLLSLFLSGITYAQSPKQAHLFNLDDVRLLESDFFDAQQTDINYMLEMDMDRLLAPYMLEAGLPWKAERYTNWENTGLDGHIGGHYVSALSMMYAATGRVDLKERLDYMVDHLAQAQKAHGDGYLAGIPNGRGIWKDIKAGKINAESFSLNNHWVPLYNIHKIFAGMADAYIDGKNEQAKEVLDNLGNWFLDIIDDLTEDQIQYMLGSEHGGFNEIFAIMYEISENPAYLDAAKKMSHQEILKPLIAEEDKLTGYHANTQIPKVIGYQKIGLIDNNEEWKQASQFFWDRVVNYRSVAIGGNSVREHFHPSDDFSEILSSVQGPETCNTYNMLKLTELLFQDNPAAHYADYYERALYNHILSSQHPDGGFVYFTPMRPNHYRVYSQPHKGFWCCVGSGLENHSKYGKFIYAHSEDELFVNLFIPSSLTWEGKGIEVIQQTKFPFEENSSLSLKMENDQRFILRIRKPSWVADAENLQVRVNGTNQQTDFSDGYISINRKWSNGDKITIQLPMEMHKESLPDNSSWATILYGPIVLAAADRNVEILDGIWADDSRMGHIAHGEMKPLNTADIFFDISNDELKNVQPSNQSSLNFILTDNIHSIRNETVTLEPFYRIHEARYQMYWPTVTKEEEITARRAQLSEKDEVYMRLAALTVDEIALGEQQPEADHFYKSGKTKSGNIDGFFWRSPEDWMTYQLQNKNQKAEKIQLTYIPSEANSRVNIFINGKLLTEEEIGKTSDKAPFTKSYNLSQEMKDSRVLEIRLEAVDGFSTPKINHIRLLKDTES